MKKIIIAAITIAICVAQANAQARRKNRQQDDPAQNQYLTIGGHKLGESAPTAFQTNIVVQLEGFDAFKTMELNYSLYEGKLCGLKFVSERCQAKGEIQKLIQYIGENFFNKQGLTKSTTKMKNGDISYEITMKGCPENKKEGYVTIIVQNEFLRNIDAIYATGEGIPCRLEELCGAISYDEKNEIYVINCVSRGKLSEGPRRKPEELGEVTVLPPENWVTIENDCKAGQIERHVNSLWKIVKKYQDLKYGILSANYLIAYYKAKDDIASAERVTSSVCGMRRIALAKKAAEAEEKAKKDKAEKEAREYELKEKAIADALANPQTDTWNAVYECLSENSKRTDSWKKRTFEEMKGRPVSWKGKVVDVIQETRKTKTAGEIMTEARQLEKMQDDMKVPDLFKKSFNEIYEKCKKDAMVTVASLVVDMGPTDVAVKVRLSGEELRAAEELSKGDSVVFYGVVSDSEIEKSDQLTLTFAILCNGRIKR